MQENENKRKIKMEMTEKLLKEEVVVEWFKKVKARSKKSFTEKTKSNYISGLYIFVEFLSNGPFKNKTLRELVDIGKNDDDTIRILIADFYNWLQGNIFQLRQNSGLRLYTWLFYISRSKSKQTLYTHDRNQEKQRNGQKGEVGSERRNR